MSFLFAAVVFSTLAQQETSPQPKAGAVQEELKPEEGWNALGKNIWFDAAKKRLVVRSKVVLREGPLEHLLCLKGTKEHEAILAADVSAKQIHAGLLLTGAEPGHPVRFLPKFEPPTGTTIEVEVVWKVDGKSKRVDAREWLKDEKTRKPLSERWVFAGSELYEDPITKKTMYAADEGDLITVANFGSAILDLPLESSASNAERLFAADTEKVPPVGTDVFLVLSPHKEKPAKP
jgi:hypothetical protein